MADGVHRLGFQNIQKATRSDFIAAGQSDCPLSPGKDRAKVRLYSRPGNDLTYRFPVIVETVARCIIDGEAVEPADLGKLIAEDTEKWGNVIRAANIQGGVIYKGSTASAIIIEPMGSGLRGITFRYAHEVRSEAQYFADIPRIALPTRC